MKEFKAKVSYGILIPALAVLAGSVIWPILEGAPSTAIITMCAIILPTALFVLHLFFNTTYRISEDNRLQVRCGFVFREAIDIMKVTSVEKTKTPVASPAPSMDRIELRYGKYGSLIISPRDKKGLVRELLRINPDIQSSIG